MNKSCSIQTKEVLIWEQFLENENFEVMLYEINGTKQTRGREWY